MTLSNQFQWNILVTLFCTQCYLTIEGYDIRLKDNTPKGTQLAANVLPDLRGEHRIYSLLRTRGSQYFLLNNRTGQLSSARQIDRDLLCTESGLCCSASTTTSLDSNGRPLAGSSSLHISQTCLSQRFGPTVMAQACVFNLSVSVVSAAGQQPDIHQLTVTICEENDHVPQFRIPGTDIPTNPAWNTQPSPNSFLSEPVQYILNISEGVPVGHRISLPLAEDIDAAPFNVQRYELERLDSLVQPGSRYVSSRVSQTPFRLETIWDNAGRTNARDTLPYSTDEARGSIINLELVVVESLDRETVPRYRYRVLAMDGGSPPLTGTLMLEIRVLDTNDHAPQFTQPLYEVTVDEGVTGKEIIQLVTHDADEGLNAVVRYDWPDNLNTPTRARVNNTHSSAALTEPITRDDLMAAPPNYWFHLNGETGTISIRRPLDYEIKSQHRFHIIAHNPSSPRTGESVDRRESTHQLTTATASVIVNVRNLDDEPPHIVIDYASGPNQAYKEIKENSASSFFVAFVTVSDPDVVSEMAKSANRLGSVHSGTYSNPTLYGSHAGSALSLGQPMISCHLESHQDAYTLVQQNDHAKTGSDVIEQRYSLLTQRSLDREQSAIDRIRIVCHDSGSPPKTATATAEVRVLDENDCTPELQIFSSFGAHSNRQAPIDPWPSNKLGQWIEEHRDGSALIHPSLMAAYMAQVPVFTVHVTENQPVGTIFARIRATDLDAGENGRVTFDSPKFPPLINVSHSPSSQYAEPTAHHYGKIELPSSNEAQELFTIDSSRGDVSTRKAIDREEGHTILDQVFMVVRATDHGSPMTRTSLILLHILIDDENDNPPMFVEPKMHFSILENLPAPAIVGEIHVIDPDLRPLGHFDSHSSVYDFQGSSYAERSEYAVLHPYPRTRRKNALHVRIDPSHNRRDLPFILYPTADGRFFLNTTRALDRESEEAFQFTLVAVDGADGLHSVRTMSDSSGRPHIPVHHTATASVLITVLDANDNQPEIIFPNPSASNLTVRRFSFREHEGYEIVTINANDRDAGEANGKFYFELVPGSPSEDLFTIDRVTGLLRTRRRLTKEDLGEHTLHLVVRDQGDPPLETQLTLRLIVDQSEPHWPYTSRTQAGSKLSASHTGPAHNANGYLGRDMGSASSDRFYPEDAELLGTGDTKRPMHADIMLFVIVALIFALVIVMLGLCIYLRHKRNLFLFLPDMFGGCLSCSSATADNSSAMAAKNNYSKTYLDLEHRGKHTGSTMASPGLMTNLLSGENVIETESHPFESTSPLQSPVSPTRGHTAQNSGCVGVSGSFGQLQSRSSFNLNSPYGNYSGPKDAAGCSLIDGIPVCSGVTLSSNMIASEGLFYPPFTGYRPGTTMGVNIPDVANQAETMRKRHVGYSRTAHSGTEYGPRMGHLLNSAEFATSGNVPVNTYNVGHYASRRMGQTYATPENTSLLFPTPASFEPFSQFGFQTIDEDMHPYQRIGHGEEYERDRGLALQSNPLTAKSSQGRHSRLKTGRCMATTLGPHEDPVVPAIVSHPNMEGTWKSQMSQWRSDPSLNHFDVSPTGPYLLRSGHRSTYEFNNTIHTNGTPRKPLKRSNSNKHASTRGISGYYSTLHESVKQPGSPKMMLVDLAGSKLTTNECTRPAGNYAVSFPKFQASFV